MNAQTLAPASLREGDDVMDCAKFATTPLVREPFDFIVVPGFIRPRAVAAASAAFPAHDLSGVLPAPSCCAADGFGKLLAALRRPETTRAFADKFGLPLSADTLMVTLRQRCRQQDGRIHTDSGSKVITALIYLNEDWSDDGGRLRILRGPDDIEDMIAEVPPIAGTLLAFRRSDNSWHGHKPFEGVRRSIMLNWMIDATAARRELRRHALTARFKSFVAALQG